MLLAPFPFPFLGCNTPDVTFPICTQLLPFPALSYIYFSGSGLCLRVLFSFSCISYHVIMCIAFTHVFISCIRAFFPVVRFAFRRFVLLRWSFLLSFHVWGLNISGLDRELPSGLGLLLVDCLSSFVPFRLRLMLQRLTEGPKRPRVCCSQTPLKYGPKPT